MGFYFFLVKFRLKGRGQRGFACAGKATSFTLPTVENPYLL